jgi:uncharacterized protein YjbJ (UPF0337 family)
MRRCANLYLPFTHGCAKPHRFLRLPLASFNDRLLRQFPTFASKEAHMNQDQIKGKSSQFVGKIKETWGRLTDDDLTLYEGKRDRFIGKVQERYGIQKEEAEKKLRDLEENFRDGLDHAA